jgi:hypothetical protein
VVPAVAGSNPVGHPKRVLPGDSLDSADLDARRAGEIYSLGWSGAESQVSYAGSALKTRRQVFAHVSEQLVAWSETQA